MGAEPGSGQKQNHHRRQRPHFKGCLVRIVKHVPMDLLVIAIEIYIYLHRGELKYFLTIESGLRHMNRVIGYLPKLFSRQASTTESSKIVSVRRSRSCRNISSSQSYLKVYITRFICTRPDLIP